MTDRRNLPLSALRAFESAATYLHLGKAGTDLGVTHGAVSHQIRSLEEKLGVQLFSRAHNRLTLTPAGSRLFQSVKSGFDTLLDGTRNLDPNDLSGPLVIACTQTIATSWAIKHICEFSQAYPTIDISVREIAPRAKSISRDVDVSICYGQPTKDDRNITKLASPLLYPVCSPRILQDHKRKHKTTDILSFVLIHDHQVSWKRWLSHYGMDKNTPKSNIHFPNTSQALNAARLGHGIALGNTFETQEYIREGQLVRMLDKSIEEENSYFLLTHNGTNKTLKTQIFAEWIIQACEPA